MTARAPPLLRGETARVNTDRRSALGTGKHETNSYPRDSQNSTELEVRSRLAAVLDCPANELANAFCSCASA